MHNKHKHSQKEKATVNEYAKTNDPSHDSAKALEDGLTELYLDVETVWIIARDLFQVTDQYLIKHIDANLPVLKLPSEGLVLKCSACGRSASFGSSGIRKNCYYCGELLLKPTNDEIADISSLFIPPKMNNDNDPQHFGFSSYTYASPATRQGAEGTELQREYPSECEGSTDLTVSGVGRILPTDICVTCQFIN